MQRTRLDSILTGTTERITGFFRNPWRNLALLFISILLGFFVGSVTITSAGQAALWDVPAAAVTLAAVEIISRFHYRVSSRNSIWLNVLNVFKMGLTFSLFLEAFKIGS